MRIARDGRNVWASDEGTPTARHTVSHPPLVGRQRVLESLASFLRDSQWGGTVLAGKPGVGKTRLLNEVAETGRADGMLVLNVHADSATRRSPLYGVTSAMTGAGMAAPASPADAAPITAAQRRTPVLLCVDDSHLLDEESSALVLRLARDRTGKAVVVTCDGNPVNEAVLALWKEGRLARTSVDPLTEDEASQVADAMLGRPLAPVSAARFAMLAGGNLVALRELITCAVEEGVLTERAGVWAEGDGDLHSSRLTDLIDPLLQSLAPAERWAMEALSIGHSLPLSVATSVAPTATWEALESRGLVSVSGRTAECRITVADTLMATVLVAQIPVLRRRRLLDTLLRSLGESEAARGSADVDTVVWRLELGEELPEAEILRASRKAWWANDWRASTALAESAWAQHHTPSSGLFLAKVMIHHGRRAEAESVLAQVAATGGPAEAAAARRTRERMRLVRGAPVPSARTDSATDSAADSASAPVAGPAVAPSAESSAESPADLDSERRAITAGATVDAAIARMMDGKPRESWKIAEGLLRSEEPGRVAMAGSAALVALLSMGRPHDCLALVPQLSRAGEALQSVDVMDYDALNLRVLLSYARATSGETRRAESELREAIREAAAARNRTLANRAGVFLARLLFDQGKVAEANRLFAAACDDDLLLVRQVAAGGALYTALHLGNEGLIDAAYQRLAVPSTEGPRRVEIDVAHAMFEVHHGRVESAATILKDAARVASSAGAFGELADVVHTLTRIEYAQDAVEFLPAGGESVQGRVDRLRIDFALAAAKGDPRSVAEAAEGFEASSTPLYAAEAWAMAARLFRKKSESRLASAASRRCTQARKKYHGVPTYLLRVVDEVVPLSRREREIAMQAAAGRSNKEIAEQLVISVRTVDNHLYRIYRKLGVLNRRALRSLLQERGM
ncbi:LuxR family transcriptional regulator [Streptomyces ficellus]|uniref:Helix-turn-helix transcriptional regulator n=1 Tax=Streptomyces ficellus TaxID=1977088 RepID=A0A6I6FII4_9ACTN|nr:LuxR family transcriptional regulator [Streptomyces ficellus]QGV77298.1 helix-turn-helix transcriptional regulator [Streptomyces ficellus]